MGTGTVCASLVVAWMSASAASASSESSMRVRAQLSVAERVAPECDEEARVSSDLRELPWEVISKAWAGLADGERSAACGFPAACAPLVKER